MAASVTAAPNSPANSVEQQQPGNSVHTNWAQFPKKVVINAKHRSLSMADLAFAFHAISFLIFMKVWGWHLSPQAQNHPGARGFGWFFRYLTFCSFTLQSVTLGLSALSDVVRQESPHKRWLAALADDLSCAVFALANAVTIMYIIVDRSTKGDVEGRGAERPAWLGFAVHELNSIIAWTDLAVGHPRSFSRRSTAISLFLATFYLGWIVTCSHFNGVFPYPFLNRMPWPQGFLSVAVAAIILFFLLFRAGKLLSAPILRWRDRKAKSE